MADMHTYDRNDIERYLQQQMSREEMHAFEKAMLDDPFLADAFEGFGASDAGLATKHLAEIEQQISGTKETAKVVPMVSSSKRWLRIAAMIIVIAGAGIITYKVLDRPETIQEVAANKSTAPGVTDTVSMADKPLATPELSPDTKAPNLLPSVNKDIAANKQKSGSPIIKQQPPIPRRQPTGAGRETINAETDSIQGRAMALKGNTSTNVNQAPPTALSAPSKAEAREASNASRDIAKKQAVSEREFKGKVIDAEGKPLPFASVSIDNHKGVVVDREGNFSIKAADSVVEVNVASAGYAPVKILLRSETNNQIRMDKSSSDLAEVVTIGYGSKTKARIADKNAAPVEPEGGWQNFRRYVDSSLQKSKTSGEDYVSGDVELEFKVDGRGNPIEIKSLNQPSKALENKAVDLLKKGPRWKPAKKNTKAKVVIQF